MAKSAGLTILNRLEGLVEKIRDDSSMDNNKKEQAYDVVTDYVSACIAYHNTAASEGWVRVMIEKVGPANASLATKYAEKEQELNKSDIEQHLYLVDRTRAINGLCEKLDVPKIYEGYIDPAETLESGYGQTFIETAEAAEVTVNSIYQVTQDYMITPEGRKRFEDHVNYINSHEGMDSMLKRMQVRTEALLHMREAKEPVSDSMKRLIESNKTLSAEWASPPTSGMTK